MTVPEANSRYWALQDRISELETALERLTQDTGQLLERLRVPGRAGVPSWDLLAQVGQGNDKALETLNPEMNPGKIVGHSGQLDRGD